MNKIILGFLIGLIASAFVAGPAAAGSKQPATPSDAIAAAARTGPKAIFPTPRHEFQPVVEGVKLSHDFIIENQGDAPLVIKNIRPD